MVVYFKFSIRTNPATGSLTGYYRLVESYRNADNRVCQKTILTVGFMEDTNHKQRVRLQELLSDRYVGIHRMFEPDDDVIVKKYMKTLGPMIDILREKDLDPKTLRKEARLINADTMKHSNAREIGAESMCFNEWEQLGIAEVLKAQGWNQEQIQLAATQVVSRAVYPASELKTSRWIKENSAICELTGYDPDQITKDKLYTSALDLFEVKDVLEKHLSKRTNDMFGLEDKIILFDLTNTYFELRPAKVGLELFQRWKT